MFAGDKGLSPEWSRLNEQHCPSVIMWTERPEIKRGKSQIRYPSWRVISGASENGCDGRRRFDPNEVSVSYTCLGLRRGANVTRSFCAKYFRNIIHPGTINVNDTRKCRLELSGEAFVVDGYMYAYSRNVKVNRNTETVVTKKKRVNIAAE